MTRLHAIPVILLIVLSALSIRPAETAEQNITDAFAAMLEENIKAADLVAHVEVTGVSEQNRSGDHVRYRIDARTLKHFKGPSTDRPVFYWWVGEKLKDDLVGAGIIVTLLKNPVDQQYYIPDNGYSFPASPALLRVANSAVRKN